MNINKPEFKFKRTATVIDSMYIKDVRESQSDSNYRSICKNRTLKTS